MSTWNLFLWQMTEGIHKIGIFSLPPISNAIKESNSGYTEGCVALYRDAFSSPHFMYIFGIGVCLWYSFDSLGWVIWEHLVALKYHKKIGKMQFAGNFISITHATMIAGASTLVTTQYSPQQALDASFDEPIITIYKYAATLSAAYYFLDTIFIIISYHYDYPIDKKIASIIHHFCSGICLCSVLLTHPIVTYISALNFLMKWTTVILNIRIFARIWSIRSVYFFSGLGVIISYPLTQILWNSYMIFITLYSEYLTVYACPEARWILGGAQIFVCLVSIYYYLTLIMKNPSQMYRLSEDQRNKFRYYPLQKVCTD